MESNSRFKYRGLSLEELKKLSLEEFSKLVPSNLRRKIIRGFTEEENKLLKKIRAGEKNIKTHARDALILPEMVGLSLGVHNGKEFFSINIVEEMIGHRLGEFALTRKIAEHSGKSAKKKTSVRK